MDHNAIEVFRQDRLGTISTYMNNDIRRYNAMVVHTYRLSKKARNGIVIRLAMCATEIARRCYIIRLIVHGDRATSPSLWTRTGVAMFGRSIEGTATANRSLGPPTPLNHFLV